MGGLLGRYKEHRESSSAKRMGSKHQISPLKPTKRGHHKDCPKAFADADTMKSGWTTAELSVPPKATATPTSAASNNTSSNDPLADELAGQIVVETPPVPPPRKHRSAAQRRATLERRRLVERLEATLERSSPALDAPATPIDPYAHATPVVEPPIVARREPVHVCDGHCGRTCNVHRRGDVVVHDDGRVDERKKKASAPSTAAAAKKKKTLSTVSLPNYDELSRAPAAKRHRDATTAAPPPATAATGGARRVDGDAPAAAAAAARPKITRHVSVLSLPTESRIVLSAATAARVENYMRRCRSFQGLTPKQLLERLQAAESTVHSDSDDSWDGMNDWDMELHPHQSSPLRSPLEPKCRLDVSQKQQQQQQQQDRAQQLNEQEQQEPSPQQIKLKMFPTSVLREIAERRESIDDFFETKAPSSDSRRESLLAPPDEPAVSLGRRGSDAFFVEAAANALLQQQESKEREEPPAQEPVIIEPPPKVEKDSLRSKIYYTNALLQSECSSYSPRESSKSTKVVEAPKVVVVVVDEVKEVVNHSSSNDTDNKDEVDGPKPPHQNNRRAVAIESMSSSVKYIDEDDDDELEVTKKDDPLDDSFKEFYETHRVLSAGEQHSPLLKIIQENSGGSGKSMDEAGVKRFPIPEPLRSAIVDVDRKISSIGDAATERHEID